MASSSPPYRLVTATIDGIPAIIAVVEDAFAEDPLTPHLRGDSDPAELYRRSVDMNTAAFEHRHLAGTRYVLESIQVRGKYEKFFPLSQTLLDDIVSRYYLMIAV